MNTPAASGSLAVDVCSRVSAGCVHCYAETVAGRFSGAQVNRTPHSRALLQVVRDGMARSRSYRSISPIRWTRPRRIFVNSMSDLFHPSVPDDYIAAVFGVMMYARQHSFQILTKRPARMRDFLRSISWEACHSHANTIFAQPGMAGGSAWERAYKAGAVFPLANVWLGVSVEHQAAADERIPLLLDTPAAVRFLSCEPLIGPVTLAPWLPRAAGASGLDWVIAGGESGAGARPMHPDWPRRLRDECVASDVAFFFKQYGEFVGGPLRDAAYAHVSALTPDGQPFSYSADPARGTRHVLWNGDQATWTSVSAPPTGAVILERVGKKRAGRELDGLEWNQMPTLTTDAG